MNTKIDQVRELWNAGDKVAALRIVAKFPRLGDEKKAIEQAWAAHSNPTFYRQIGHCPETLLEKGLDAIAHRYAL